MFTDGGAVHLYEEETDRELRFETIEELTACLDADEATALPSTPGESRRPYFHWR